ncbi:MAG: hypothetical protein ACTS8S_18695 [Giesbergeria sp.]
MKKFVLMTIAPVVLLAACSNPKEANEKNFKAALQAHYDRPDQAICVQVSAPHDRVTKTGEKIELKPIEVQSNSKGENILFALAKAGLFTEEVRETPNPNRWEKNNPMLRTSVFSLSDEGRKFIRDGGGAFSHRLDFCTGKLEVISITNFTQPTELLGFTTTTIRYKTKVAGQAPWLTDEVLKAAFLFQERNFADGADARAPLLLTNNGWMHEKDFNRQ